MKRNFSCLLPAAAVFLLTAFLLTASAQAQGPGGPGGFQPPPGMQAKFQAWRTWRDTHPNIVSLERTLGALADVAQNPQTKLTKPQAHTILAVMKKWQGKPALTDAQAGLVNAQITHTLNPTQLSRIAAAAPQRGGFGGGRGPGGPPPGGFGGRPGGFGGGRPGFDPASFPAPRDYNPLNPSTQPMVRRRDRDQQRHNQLMAALLASAH